MITVKKIRFSGSIILILLILIVNSCRKDDMLIEEPNFNRPVNMSSPYFNIFFDATNLVDFIDDIEYLHVDESDSSLYFSYEMSLDQSFDQILTIEGFTLPNTVQISEISNNVNIKMDTIITFEYPFKAPNGMDLDRIILEEGDLNIDVIAPDNCRGSYEVSFTTFSDDIGNIIVNSNKFHNGASSVSLDNGEMSFVKRNDSLIIPIKVHILIDSLSGTSSTDIFNVNTTLSGVKPLFVDGYFGQQTLINYKSSKGIALPLDYDFIEKIALKELMLDVELDNYIGVPLSLYLDSTIFKKTDKSSEVFLELGDNNSIDIQGATINSGFEISPGKSMFSFDNSNSNVIDIINSFPDSILMNLNAVSNPDGPGYNFISTKDIKMGGKVNLTVPIWFKVSQIERFDTVNFDIVDMIDDSTQIEAVEEININLDFYNGFPFEVGAQVYMATEEGIIIDSLFNSLETLLHSPEINPTTGRVTNIAESNLIINIKTDAVKKMYDSHVKKFILKTNFMTANEEFVKLYVNHTLGMRLSVDIKSNND